MLKDIELRFPGLHLSIWRITSPATDAYNCVGWAVHDINAWWWPGDPQLTFWPEGVEREESLPAFVAALTTRGFAHCDNEELEPGQEKIALFADAQGHPKHVARQLPTGRWTGKLGFLEDIEHDLNALEGAEYGTVLMVMKRLVVQ